MADFLIATIYRPKDPTQNDDSATFTGDMREKFNEAITEKRAKSVAAVGMPIKLSILSWFSVALMDVIADRPNVFPKQTEKEKQSAPEDQSDARTWMSVFRDPLGPK